MHFMCDALVIDLTGNSGEWPSVSGLVASCRLILVPLLLIFELIYTGAANQVSRQEKRL